MTIHTSRGPCTCTTEIEKIEACGPSEWSVKVKPGSTIWIATGRDASPGFERRDHVGPNLSLYDAETLAHLILEAVEQQRNR